MIYKCPGQDKRKLEVEDISCQFCGYKIEFFSDEFKTNCPSCQNLTYKGKLPNCAFWCKAAKDCIGEEKWKQLKEEE